jgi:hypothetical protein
MVAELDEPLNPGRTAGFPEELLESRYAVNRDEILWRRYNEYLSRGGPRNVNDANRVLYVIRKTPD